MIQIRLFAILALLGTARAQPVDVTSRVRSRRRLRRLAWGAEQPRSAMEVPAGGRLGSPPEPEPGQATTTPGPVRRRRRVVVRTLTFGICALLAAAFFTATPRQATGWNQGAAEATLWQLLNGARENNGRAPLQQHSTLVSLARWRSSDMLAKSYFSHTIVGCGCLVYAYYDSNGLSYDWAGENIGWNSGLDDSYSPVRVHEAFMGSPGHRANVLDASFTHGGVGAAAADNKPFQGHTQNTRMYTELFMQAIGGGPAPQPSSSPPTRSGNGGGDGGGGGQTAVRPTPGPTPVARIVAMDTPQRPHSTAGIDGVSEVVSPRPSPDPVGLHRCGRDGGYLVGRHGHAVRCG